MGKCVVIVIVKIFSKVVYYESIVGVYLLIFYMDFVYIVRVFWFWCCCNFFLIVVDIFKCYFIGSINIDSGGRVWKFIISCCFFWGKVVII